MDANPPTSKLKRLKEALALRGLSPRKMFGQNFMVDTNFAAAIARDAALDEKTLAIEIGPGTGLLTEALLAAHPLARVLAVEIDHGLAALLRETFGHEISSGRLTLVEGDALDGKHHLSAELVENIISISAKEHRTRRIICANLPYNAGTPILAVAALDLQNIGIDAALVTVQLELAERMLALPGSEAYGSLSVLMALRACGRIERTIGSEVFWPRPSVASALLRLEFQPWTQMQKSEAAGIQVFLQKIFSQRRKTLRAALKPLLIPEALVLLAERRAEDLSAPQLLELYRGIQET